MAFKAGVRSKGVGFQVKGWGTQRRGGVHSKGLAKG